MQAMAEAPAAAEAPGAGAPGAASAGSTLAGGAQAAPAADTEAAAEGLEEIDATATATTTDPVPSWHPRGVGGHSACFIGETPKILVFGGGFINDEDIEEDVNQVRARDTRSPGRISAGL